MFIPVFLSFIGLGLVAMLVGWVCQKKQWNSGISPYDSTPWIYFDTNSQGGRGYHDNSDNYIWIDAPFIDNNHTARLNKTH